jgi:hypothetical protein
MDDVAGLLGPGTARPVAVQIQSPHLAGASGRDLWQILVAGVALVVLVWWVTYRWGAWVTTRARIVAAVGPDEDGRCLTTVEWRAGGRRYRMAVATAAWLAHRSCLRIAYRRTDPTTARLSRIPTVPWELTVVAGVLVVALVALR